MLGKEIGHHITMVPFGKRMNYVGNVLITHNTFEKPPSTIRVYDQPHRIRVVRIQIGK